MRCPSCGFVSFDHLSACKKCGKELPLPPSGRRMAAPLPVPPSAVSEASLFAAPAGDPGSEPILVGESAASAAPPKRADDAFSFDLPPAAILAAPPAEADDAPAGFWIRFVALAIDVIVQGILLGAATVALLMVAGASGALMGGLAGPSGAEAFFGALGPLIAVLAAIWLLGPLIYSIVFLGWRGQTPGKMLLRVKVIRTDGGEVDYVKAFIRTLVFQVLSIFAILAAFNKEKRTLHDYAAGTRVVRL